MPCGEYAGWPARAAERGPARGRSRHARCVVDRPGYRHLLADIFVEGGCMPDPSSPKTSSVSPEACVVGVDFGTLSGRVVVVRVRDGAELGSAVSEYAHGVVDGRLPDGPTLP